MYWTKRHLNIYCLSLQMYLKNLGSLLQLTYNIGLISLMRQSSLPTTVVIIYPSLSWMSLKSKIDSMPEKGWIAPSTSPYRLSILFAHKKDGSLQLCMDFRSLNANTILDRYPLPCIDELLDHLNGYCVISSLDL